MEPQHSQPGKTGHRMASKRRDKLMIDHHHHHYLMATLILASLMIVASASNQDGNKPSETMGRPIVPLRPHRPVPADVILLDNGSNTSVLSLEEYLSQIEQQQQDVNKEPLKSNTNSAVVTLPRTEVIAMTGDNHKVAALSQVEREEITTNAPNSSKHHHEIERPPPPPPEKPQAEIKHDPHHKEKHGHNHHHEQASGENSTGPKPIPQHYQVRSLLNVTHDFPLTHSRLIYGYIWPMMAAITLFSNLMIVFVLTQQDMRTPTNVVLTAIAIADIIPIVVPVPWFIYLFAMGNEKRVLYPPIACYFYQHLTRSVSEIFYFLSTWLNVLLAVQDYLTACLPHLAKRYCQLRVVVMQIVTLTLLAFLLNLPQALKLVFKPVKFYYNNELTWGCKALQARWFKDLIGEYVALYDDIFAAIIVIFVDGGPAALLITLTALLIRQLQKQRIKGHLLMEQARTASKRRRERYRQQEYESSAKVMIFVLLASLAVKIPFATTYTMMIIQSRFEIHFVENLVDFQSAITITDLAFVLSYPVNFTIFCCCSKKFRHKCAQLLGECTHNTKTTRNRLMSSFSMSLNNSTTSQIYKRPSISTVASQTPHHHQYQQQHHQNHLQQPHHQDSGTATLNGLSLDKDMADSDGWLEPFRQQQQGDSLMSGAGSLDERRPLVLERLCDGRHHLEWLHPGDRPPHFRALLADGSQCQECLARHEDLWASRGRRTSADSTGGSWPLALPPPLPPLNIHYGGGGGQRGLPQIVTTRCESIREQPSSDEANGDEAICDVEPPAAAAAATATCSMDEQQPETDDDTAPGSSTAEFTSMSVNPMTSLQQQQQYHRGARQTQESLQEQIDRHEQQQQQQQQQKRHHQHGDDDHHLLKIKPPGQEGHHGSSKGSQLGVHCGSDPGSGSSFMSIKYLTGLVMRRLSGSQEDRNSCRADYAATSGKQAAGGGAESGPDDGAHFKELMDDKHSSLSLSNSKLSTLPNATVQLADTLMSTLFMAPGTGGGGGGGQRSGASTSSEPAARCNLLGRRTRRRSKDSRRSHG